jgi:hypothetical protein
LTCRWRHQLAHPHHRLLLLLPLVRQLQMRFLHAALLVSLLLHVCGCGLVPPAACSCLLLLLLLLQPALHPLPEQEHLQRSSLAAPAQHQQRKRRHLLLLLKPRSQGQTFGSKP